MATIALCVSSSSFGYVVDRILSICVGYGARGVVALMANKETIGDGAKVEFIREAVGKSASAHSPVSPLVEWPIPKPTLITSTNLDVIPEVTNLGWFMGDKMELHWNQPSCAKPRTL